jgi:hypothetical protein
MKPGHGGAGNAWVMPNMPGASVMVQSASGDENSSMSVSQFSDGEHSITLQPRDGKRTVSIADRAGKVLLTGPDDTDAEKAKVPAELAEKIKQMEENQKHVPQEMFAPPALPPGPM